MHYRIKHKTQPLIFLGYIKQNIQPLDVGSPQIWYQNYKRKINKLDLLKIKTFFTSAMTHTCNPTTLEEESRRIIV
jgi:hypothetical protein